MTPPPMMTARACEGSAGMREPLAEKETTRSRLEATAMARPEGFCPSPHAFPLPSVGEGCEALANACVSLRRSEEHTSELQSLMRISYAVFCLKKTKKQIQNRSTS